MQRVAWLVAKIVIIFTIVLATAYTPSAIASGAKVQLNINGTQSYYGEVKDGKPHGSKKVIVSGTDPSGEYIIYSNAIETGFFQNGLLKQGYHAAYELTDSPFVFRYLGPDGFILNVTHQDEQIIKNWNQGLNFVTYQKGKTMKDYSNLPVGDEEEDAANAVTLRFLRSVKQEILPQLKQFETMAKMVKLDEEY